MGIEILLLVEYYCGFEEKGTRTYSKNNSGESKHSQLWQLLGYVIYQNKTQNVMVPFFHFHHQEGFLYISSNSYSVNSETTTGRE